MWKRISGAEKLNLHKISFCPKITEKPKFDCEICGNTYFSQTSLSYHKKHHSIEPTKCTYCDYVCKYADRLKRHIQQIHLKDNIKCKYCSAEFSEKRKLNTHLKEIHPNKSY